MPKKTRREKERAARRRATGEWSAPAAQPVDPSAVTDLQMATRAPGGEYQPSARKAGSVASRAAAALTFDYSYVFGDLRRIAILAVLFFSAMIALSFVLR